MAQPERVPAGRVAVLEEAGTPDPEARFFGEAVRELRAAKQLTLRELAERTDLSVGYLSQVERGLSNPSVSAVQAIAGALGVTAGWFFRAPSAPEGSEAAFVVRAGARRRLAFASGITDELLSPHLGGALELLLSRFAPGSASGEAPYAHRGEEAGVVLSGTLELWIEAERFLLGAGDSFAFPSTRPHRYRNPGAEETVVIWVITPPTY
ncbi:helix-turn-helix domain-containing protein [Rubellimicrobium sp. CFH 75288]|uniref:helix-turn-helix domain-containing protein n=1 Tax=Rubellimicrobium sp. CFH 75288 TaxID=2697034 RepID=UPI0014135FF6|nr:XRE family transcriptional regulator [Rubellimicrobium sp. CFH 75288]NAZ37814.1 cupin domain-containing protein [Rubellimicrobium sp. CFH 75288]